MTIAVIDNFHMDITGTGVHNLDLAIELGFSQHPKASHWRIHHDSPQTRTGRARRPGPDRFILAWRAPEPAVKTDLEEFPFPHTHDLAAAVVSHWLEQVAYPDAPGIDGSLVKAWRVYNDALGFVHHHWWEFLAIAPVWGLVAGNEQRCPTAPQHPT